MVGSLDGNPSAQFPKFHSFFSTGIPKMGAPEVQDKPLFRWEPIPAMFAGGGASSDDTQPPPLPGGKLDVYSK